MGGFNSKDRIFRQDGGVSDNGGGGLQGPYQNRDHQGLMGHIIGSNLRIRV